MKGGGRRRGLVGKDVARALCLRCLPLIISLDGGKCGDVRCKLQ